MMLASLFSGFDLAIDGPIVLAGSLCAMACALLGNFLVLRRMSMMGDAISHAVLPGLALAFIITGSRDSTTMLIGAVVVGVLTAVLTQAISHFGKVESGAAMGVVFTSLFALGLVLIQYGHDNKYIDLDPSCVLYGELSLVATQTGIPRVIYTLGIIYVINLAVIIALYKELKLVSFDPALATTLGINAQMIHYLMMVLVAATTVACFEAVGSILVVAMLIVPAATAFLLTRRLSVMIILSQVLAILIAVVGHFMALKGPAIFGFGSTVTSGAMAAVAGAMFAITLIATTLVRAFRHRTASTYNAATT